MTNHEEIARRRKVERMQTISRNLCDLLDERGWNQSELARRSSLFLPDRKPMSKQSVSHFLTAGNIPSRRSLAAMAQALGVAPERIDPMTDMVANASHAPAVAVSAAKPLLVVDALDGTATINVAATMPLERALRIMAILSDVDK